MVSRIMVPQNVSTLIFLLVKLLPYITQGTLQYMVTVKDSEMGRLLDGPSLITKVLPNGMEA